MEILKQNIYYVKATDTIESVCKKNKVQLSEVQKLNYITNEIETGDILFLPKGYDFEYIVKPNDTIELISKKFNVSIQYIKKRNGTDRFFIGQKILI